VVPLEPLLENRIGARGWFPVRANDRDLGALELAIRFTRTDDFIRVAHAAEQIGWAPSHHFQKNQPPLINSDFCKPSEPVVADSKNQKPSSQQMEAVSCLVEIEKAVHLPLVFDPRFNLNVPPSAYVTFGNNNEATKSVDRFVSPTWNYQIVSRLDPEFFLDNSKYFVLKVWHRESGPESQSKLLGCVSVDLTPLVYGLTQINGWYNINDSVGQAQGQLKLTITPQQSLLALRQVNEKRKKTPVITATATNNFDNLLTYSQCSFASLSSSTQTSDSGARPRLVSASSSELSTAPIKSLIKDTNELKIGLAQKLSELDNLNRMLKERLENKRSAAAAAAAAVVASSKPVVVSTNESRPPRQRQMSDFGAQADFVVPRVDPVVQTAVLNPAQSQADDLSKRSVVSEEASSAQVAVESCANPNNSIADSFWASFHEPGNNNLPVRNSAVYNTNEDRESDDDFVQHLPPIAPVSFYFFRAIVFGSSLGEKQTKIREKRKKKLFCFIHFRYTFDLW
jgi:hypothetical protein